MRDRKREHDQEREREREREREHEQIYKGRGGERVEIARESTIKERARSKREHDQWR